MKSSGETFVATLEEIKSAEAKAASIREEAKSKAEEIIRNARKDAEAIRLKAEKETVEMENRLISEGKAETEREVSKIIADAKKSADRAKAKKANAKLIDSLYGEVIKPE